MSIKQKTLALAAEHNIEVWISSYASLGARDFHVSLPEGFELPNGQTGFSGGLDSTHYQNWKALFEDVMTLVQQKDSWRKIQETL